MTLTLTRGGDPYKKLGIGGVERLKKKAAVLFEYLNEGKAEGHISPYCGFTGKTYNFVDVIKDSLNNKNILSQKYYDGHIQHGGAPYRWIEVDYDLEDGTISTYSYKESHHNGDHYDTNFEDNLHVPISVEGKILEQLIKDLEREGKKRAKERWMEVETDKFFKKEIEVQFKK